MQCRQEYTVQLLIETSDINVQYPSMYEMTLKKTFCFKIQDSKENLTKKSFAAMFSYVQLL